MKTHPNVSKELLKQLIQIFPNQLSFCFAYGSAVFNQSFEKKNKSSDDSFAVKNMIDLILVVDDSVQFHYNNLIKNKSHYSMLRYLGPKWLSSIQESFGAKVFFNTLIPIDNYLIKYGVISTQHLINDCLDWDSLYISGRLHKPVSVLKEPNRIDLLNALKINTQSALHSALLMLSETFTEEQLYIAIAGLSYTGDFRMSVGEDKKKVIKIVRPQMHNFRNIYQPLISSETLSQLVSWNPNSRVYIQDCSPNAMSYHLNLLPKRVQHNLAVDYHKDIRFNDIEDTIESLAHSIECKTLVKAAIEKIVWSSSWSQSFKGIFTAGLLKSVRYGSKKVIKMLRSLNH